MRRGSALLLVLLLSLGMTACGSGARSAEGGGPLLVAAASDLQPAFSELGERYEQRTGRAVTFTFGSSGQLAQQLENGAPFELYASASAEYVEQVLASGRGDAATQADYAVGRLVVWTRTATSAAPVELADLADPRFARIAIANPEHAPYGRAAEQALAAAGLEGALRDRLVYGENVTDTLRLAASGNAGAAVVALSLATARDDGVFTVVPADLHEPLRQTLVVTAEQDRAPAAQEFADLVLSPVGREVMRRYGLRLPGETAAGG